MVDFGNVGGDVAVGCAGSPGTGFDALTQAGFSLTFVQSQPGFVCRINGLPDAADEDCVDTPPADAFWSYWLADPGGTWTSSQLGGATPVETELVGWAFSLGTRTPPRYAVPAPPTTTTTTTTTTSTTTTTTTTTTTSTPTTTSTTATTRPPTTQTTPPTTTTQTTTPTTATSTATTTTEPPPTTTTTSTVPTSATSVEAAPIAARTSPVGLIVGAGLVAALAGAAWYVNRRRAEP